MGKLWIYAITLPTVAAAYFFENENPARQIVEPNKMALAIRAEKPEDRSGWHENQWGRHLAGQLDGVAEYRLPDASRVDILTDQVAFEIDWAEKWPEAVGQSIFYAISTHRRPGIILLLKGDRQKAEENYLECLAAVAYLRGRGVAIELLTIDAF
jgi:hypothetical protein